MRCVASESILAGTSSNSPTPAASRRAAVTVVSWVYLYAARSLRDAMQRVASGNESPASSSEYFHST